MVDPNKFELITWIIIAKRGEWIPSQVIAIKGFIFFSINITMSHTLLFKELYIW
jgi:hypothetical protein